MLFKGRLDEGILMRKIRMITVGAMARQFAAALVFLAAVSCPAGDGCQPVVISPASAKDVAVVANAANPLCDISAVELRKMLAGERRFWRGNVQIKLALRQAGVHEHDLTIAAVVKTSNSDFDELWRARVFRGEASEGPRVITSDAALLQYVTETPGALSFTPGRNLRSGLKVLKVDGKLPGDNGYLLKVTAK